MRILALMLSLAALASPAASAQAVGGIRKAVGMGKKSRLPPRVAKKQVDRLSAMAPEERANALSRLPPERRAQAEKRLEQYNKLSPGEREKLFRAAENMTPDQRRAVRQNWQTFEGLPPQRKPVVRRELMRLRNMNSDDRDAHLASEDFKGRFDADERRLLTSLGKALEPLESDPK